MSNPVPYLDRATQPSVTTRGDAESRRDGPHSGSESGRSGGNRAREASEPTSDGAVPRGEGRSEPHSGSRAASCSLPAAFLDAVARAHERYGTVNERLGVGVLPTLKRDGR